MKILALYDIHGNTDALDAVLGDSRAQAPDVVVVGGDAVPGPLTRQVLDRLDGFNVPVRWVRGNGEREVAAAAAGRSGGNDGLNWPHCDGLNWPHLRPTGGRLFELHRARAGGARGNGIQGGAVRADQTGP